MGSILGSSQKSNQTSTSTGAGNSQSIQASNSQQTSTSNQGSTQQSQSSTKSGLTADQVLQQWQQGAGTDYSKDAALNDVNGALKSQALDALQSVMPSINKQADSSGAYNSTTRDLLTNDATARIAGQLAQTGLNAITSYGQISNQNLSALSGVSSATGSSESSSSGSSFGNSASQGTSTSAGASQSEYDQSSTGSGSSKGGSGLLGLFADGGKVSDGDGDEGGSAGNSALNAFLDISGINGAIKEVKDTFSKAGQLVNDPQGFMSDYLSKQKKQVQKEVSPTENLRKVGGDLKNDLQVFNGQDQQDMQNMSRIINLFANGGRVPKYADGGTVQEAPMFPSSPLPQLPVININVGNGAAPPPPKDELDPESGMDQISSMMPKDDPGSAPGSGVGGGGASSAGEAAMGGAGEAAGTSVGAEAAGSAAAEGAASAAGEAAASSAADAVVAAFLADGGRVPQQGHSQAKPTPSLPPATELLAAIQRYKNGGAVRSGEEDVQEGGKIKGKQSPTGEDNQVIGVAGGEGILPKDVMQVPGVPELVQKLIQQYHTPVATK